MTRFQIKIIDADLVDLVHDITVQALTAANETAKREIRGDDVYGAAFGAVRDVLKKYVRGFHVCGCADHCEEESEPTKYSQDSEVAAQVKAIGRSRRIRRYVLSLEVRLDDFMKELEVAMAKAIVAHMPVGDWHGRLGPVLRKVVEEGLGKHIFFNPGCNRGEYLCQVGECTEFDPWDTITPDRRKG